MPYQGFAPMLIPQPAKIILNRPLKTQLYLEINYYVPTMVALSIWKLGV